MMQILSYDDVELFIGKIVDRIDKQYSVKLINDEQYEREMEQIDILADTLYDFCDNVFEKSEHAEEYDDPDYLASSRH